MNLELLGALNELEKERGISKEVLLEAVEAALVSAYKRNHGNSQNVRVDMDEKAGPKVFAQKDVVEEVEDETAEMSLEAARAIDPNFDVGDVVEIEVTPRDFGRIAAQTAKQVVIQRIREAERALVYEEYSNREGDIITGIVQRSDHRNVLVDLGKAEAVLPPPEQMAGENYYHGNRIKVYITEVRKTTKGPQVYVSRTHPGLLKRLFELEVPEIHDGIVEIKAVAREAGHRSKLAVYSYDDDVDPVGACVGPRGIRVQTVVQELRGEKIDIISWHPDTERFVSSALSPARVMAVHVNEAEKSARAVVPDHQLSLAIGKEGQNARLAARLTGWKIDIKSETQMSELAVLEAQRAFDEAEAIMRAKAEAEARGEVVEPVEEVEELVDEAEETVTEQGPEVEVATDAPVEVEPHVDDDVEPMDEDYPDVEPEDADVAYDDEEIDDFEEDFPDEVFVEAEEEDPEKAKAAPPATKQRKSRAAKKAELQAVLDEDLEDDDEEEALPSLFDDEDEDGIAADEAGPVFVTGSEEKPARKRSQPKQGKGNKGKSQDDKKVLKDLSELKDLDL